MAMPLTLAIPLTIAIPLNTAILLTMAAGDAGGVGLTAPGYTYYGYTTHYGYTTTYHGHATHYEYTYYGCGRCRRSRPSGWHGCCCCWVSTRAARWVTNSLVAKYKSPFTSCEVLVTVHHSTSYLIAATQYIPHPRTTYHSALTTYYSLLTTFYSLLTTYYSLLTTHHLLLTTYHLPPTARRPRPSAATGWRA